MSNPTTHVSAFDATAPGWTVIGPESYSNGLVLLEGTTNLCSNPSAATNTTGWATSTNRTLSRVTSLPKPLPDGLASVVTTGVSCTVSANITGSGPLLATSFHTITAAAHSLAVYLYIPSAYAGSDIITRLSGFTSATGPLSAAANMAIRDDWQRVTLSGFTPDSGDLGGNIEIDTVDSGSLVNGDVIYWTAVQLEAKPYATPFTASTRAASSASISPYGIIDTYLGAIVFRLTPTIETGVEEIWGELGEKGAGTDHIQWGRDSSKHPFVEWSGNDSAYTRITLDGTVDAGDEHFYSIEWHVGDEIFTLYQDALPGESDAIPSPQEDYGGESLTLKASAGGVIYNGILIANERLTDEQRATLLSKENWSMNTLSAPQRRYEFFQLRPGV